MSYSFLLIPLHDGIRYGIYQEYNLYKQGFIVGKSLDVLIQIWMDIKKDYMISSIFYARGPGSLSALKLLHVFVHTLAIVSKVKLFAVDSFYFSHEPILAFGNRYFIKNNHQEIILKNFDVKIQAKIPDLPEKLKVEDFNAPLEPLYILPPVN